jgi:hypothetical protein
MHLDIMMPVLARKEVLHAAHSDSSTGRQSCIHAMQALLLLRVLLPVVMAPVRQRVMHKYASLFNEGFSREVTDAT